MRGWGRGDSGILLAGVLDRQYLDGLCANRINEDVVGRDDRFPRVGRAPGAVHIGVIGQSLGSMF